MIAHVSSKAKSTPSTKIAYCFLFFPLALQVQPASKKSRKVSASEVYKFWDKETDGVGKVWFKCNLNAAVGKKVKVLAGNGSTKALWSYVQNHHPKAYSSAVKKGAPTVVTGKDGAAVSIYPFEHPTNTSINLKLPAST